MKDPLDPTKRVVVQEYDQDVIVENELSQKHQFKDMPKTDALTQNAWNMSPLTRENNFNDVFVENPQAMSKGEKWGLDKDIRRRGIPR